MCKLANFGQVKQLCKSNLKASDIYWTAPEVVNQTTTESRYSDIWSLGCIIFKLVTGYSIWHDKSPLDLRELIQTITEPPSVTSPMSEEFADFINCCL